MQSTHVRLTKHIPNAIMIFAMLMVIVSVVLAVSLDVTFYKLDETLLIGSVSWFLNAISIFVATRPRFNVRIVLTLYIGSFVTYGVYIVYYVVMRATTESGEVTRDSIVLLWFLALLGNFFCIIAACFRAVISLKLDSELLANPSIETN